ncbi:MAG: hypothetical protein JST00_08235 [Deltaproteobacteria bacterium]|nr:hypothetical protein [Deltaproteobacteria bacterium]
MVEIRKGLLIAVAALAASVVATGVLTASVYVLHSLTEPDSASAELEER